MIKVLNIGDQVQVQLGKKFGEKQGWYAGVIVRIDPYSEHRSFYWVRLEDKAQAFLGIREISVFNPRNIKKKP